MAQDALSIRAKPIERQRRTDDRVAEIMSERYDLKPREPERRLLMVAEPRCGGSLLAEALRNTGLAGVPFEYMNPRIAEAWARRFGIDGAPPFDAYMEFLLRHRTTPNGVFMMKALVAQLGTFLRRGSQTLSRLQVYDRIVLMHRRDKLAQAVSLYRATLTDAWNSHDRVEGDDGAAVNIPFDPTAISTLVQALFGHEASLEQLYNWAQRRQIPVLVLNYEELDRDFAGIWARLADFFGIAGLAEAPVRTTLEHQRDTISDRLVGRYLATLRDSGPLAGMAARARLGEGE